MAPSWSRERCVGDRDSSRIRHEIVGPWRAGRLMKLSAIGRQLALSMVFTVTAQNSFVGGASAGLTQSYVLKQNVHFRWLCLLYLVALREGLRRSRCGPEPKPSIHASQLPTGAATLIPRETPGQSHLIQSVPPKKCSVENLGSQVPATGRCHTSLSKSTSLWNKHFLV